MNISENLSRVKKSIPKGVTLVAVTKTKQVDIIMQAYNSGHKVFGENKIQEMVTKQQKMPDDIEWHMIGHLQRNKVKYIAPFVSLIHSVDGIKLLREINKRAEQNKRIISCLLQIKIAEEESKFGLSESDALDLLRSDDLRSLNNIRITGLMGMATFTNDKEQLKKEFSNLERFYNSIKNLYNFTTLSMGMSDDYPLAIELGSNMIRVGSAIFGKRSV
jgi:pyridoxal phosphate enzyme (YggS family)